MARPSRRRALGIPFAVGGGQCGGEHDGSVDEQSEVVPVAQQWPDDLGAADLADAVTSGQEGDGTREL
jgi:hypothetical protein